MSQLGPINHTRFSQHPAGLKKRKLEKKRRDNALRHAREKEGSGVICVTRMGRIYSLRKKGELTHH
ncbi:hypothetical protein KFK09_010474 [Dendrobium nobile]|uniref:Uncharacterized protein n=1 Tax=Dendrobium nobile TaxID=94219 RepID=A0A8T3BC39_DENNO|nr:hypothetical protein KFK09_010474 [Dendrobium nobile]